MACDEPFSEEAGDSGQALPCLKADGPAEIRHAHKECQFREVAGPLAHHERATDVSWTGLARDRRLAVFSRTTGKIASAKYPRLWRDLLTASASASASASVGQHALAEQV